jgi:hypothetical protein
MNKLFIIGITLPCLMQGGMSAVKNFAEQESKEILVFLSEHDTLDFYDRAYLIGRAEAFFDVIYIIERMEQEKYGH